MLLYVLSKNHFFLGDGRISPTRAFLVVLFVASIRCLHLTSSMPLLQRIFKLITNENSTSAVFACAHAEPKSAVRVYVALQYQLTSFMANLFSSNIGKVPCDPRTPADAFRSWSLSYAHDLDWFRNSPCMRDA